jgi:superfamily II DNA or RNA helicase
MKLTEFLDLHGTKMGFLETAFLTDVYFADFGEAGLDLITPEVEISRNDGSERKWRIDFVVRTANAEYAIECDGFNYHAAGMVSRERFNELESKRNETIRQGFRLVSLSKDQIVDAPHEAIYELRRSFNLDPELYSLFLRWNQGKMAPHDAQKSALNALSLTRAEGNSRGLVVMATGLGKTYTAIFDAEAFQAKRILFLVHVEHILKQAKNSFEKVMPERSQEMGFFTGNTKEHSGKNIIFATVQTMSRDANLHQFEPDHFDYVVIDEAHHTAAATYTKLSNYFQPKFFLGLTATPDRLDEQDILQFFGDNLVYEMDQEEAIKQGYLAKLHYLGFFDNVDYSKIHWNGFRYDSNDLNKLLMIKARDEAVIEKYNELAKGKKTIAFCVSIDHAEWSAEQFRLAGIDAIAIHSKIEDRDSGGAYQSASEIINAFERDEHQVVFVVDMLNEGIDIPDVECLLLLRPTQSNTIMTQQIGRGLRIAPGKEEVLVLDFIGNYRTAPLVLKGLGLGQTDLDFDKVKNVYYFDNHGRKVEFESKVIEIFKTITAKSRKEVNTQLISDDWNEYGTYISEMSKTGNNLYWSVGKKNNDLQMHRWAINLAISPDNQFGTNKELDKYLKNTWAQTFPQRKTMEGIRALFFSKLIGFIRNSDPFSVSAAYRAFDQAITLGHGDARTIASNQVEKFFFFTDIGSKVNRHAGGGETRKVDKYFSLFPIFFIYEVLYELSQRGYERPYLTKFEIEIFLSFAGKHEDLPEILERILNYRLYPEQPELEKFLKKSVSEMDTRIFGILVNIDFFKWNQDRIEIPSELMDPFIERVHAFRKLIENGKLIKFNSSDSHAYRNMLWSKEDLIAYCQQSSERLP